MLTVEYEFLLSKKQYELITGKTQSREHNILFYQIRQSFKPGTITPEETNKLGYELAMRFTKGNHAFIVATHEDKKHIHSHIYFNSTALGIKKLPSIKTLKTEYASVKSEKNKLYGEYKKAKDEVKKLTVIKANTNRLLAYPKDEKSSKKKDLNK